MPVARMVDGKAMAAAIRKEIAAEVRHLARAHGGRRPGLCAIICGDRMDSRTYVRLKSEAAEACGFHSAIVSLPSTSTQEDVVREIQLLNSDTSCHGIIVQLPLPSHIDECAAMSTISTEKDADGVLPIHVGMVHMRKCVPPVIPCTPAAVMEILHQYKVEIAGKRAAVLGYSNIVGAPVAALLMDGDATVTVVHSASPLPDIVDIVRSSDIVVSAVGKPGFVEGSWIKSGAVVIDVGTTPVSDPTRSKGYRLVGDVCFEAASLRASLITPVPGGVGPMTVAMLLRNTLMNFKKSVCTI
ncbi:Tetrahydrofolate dehydrogenase cyclohydrolase catalytic domain [Trypanosoma vivax]|uniref:Putative C-1-tetrahydrofolate synthase, cytoplasmic n=1 Tax=Trypanosoma vivax (strain Y486) TaxID=1055687 RepID=G0TXW2_TRYVY|nr:putative C-1-tetrahydrofolate synthase, cytoplasmic [Trypanosoma vivax]KAH8612665.1 Tetrahydrofolate dehydrogenase cyclohydrolase catalytic domain [Trypanosoma vivax]CCC48805.1 putative C-1-tetrahydrofolate synthase, cytoplasmic [Trypanosoma vivax Y486]